MNDNKLQMDGFMQNGWLYMLCLDAGVFLSLYILKYYGLLYDEGFKFLVAGLLSNLIIASIIAGVGAGIKGVSSKVVFEIAIAVTLIGAIIDIWFMFAIVGSWVGEMVNFGNWSFIVFSFGFLGIAALIHTIIMVRYDLNPKP